MQEKWNKFEKAWLILAVFLVVVAIIYKHLTIVSKNYIIDLVSDFSAIFGVIYVILIAKQKKIAYLFGVLNVILYALVSYDKSLYLSATYNIVYSLPVLIYGYTNWSKLDSRETSGVKKFSFWQRIFGILLIIIAITCFAFISNRFLNGNSVWLDSAVSVLICVATFLMTKKYIEQWLLFAVANFVGIMLFIPKGEFNLESIDLLTMWSIYFINSIYGWFSWKKSLLGKKVSDA